MVFGVALRRFRTAGGNARGRRLFDAEDFARCAHFFTEYTKSTNIPSELRIRRLNTAFTRCRGEPSAGRVDAAKQRLINQTASAFTENQL